MFASIPQGLSVFEEKTAVAISFMFQDKKKCQQILLWRYLLSIKIFKIIYKL